ncbi:MAG: lipid A deacylase LpxR family protein [Bacteroidota bacterium]
MRSVVAGIILSFWIGNTFGQGSNERVLRHEVRLLIENDVFTSLLSDQYYSSGIYARYSRIQDSTRVGPKLLSIINHFELSQRIYTANEVDKVRISEMDRPYAGIISFKAGKSYFFRSSHALEVQLELGWMGPKSFTGEIHEAWHQWLGLPDVNGWDTQVSDAPVINAHVRHGMQLLRTRDKNPKLDILLESHLALGSVHNIIREQLIFRFGRTLPANLSGIFGNTLGGIRPRKKPAKAMEAYIMYSPGVQYTIYNGTLQGGLLSRSPSLFTKDPNRWVYHQKFGLLLRYGTFDFNFVVHVHKPETVGVTSHQYAGIELKQRF